MGLIQSEKDGSYLTFDEEKHSYTLNGEAAVCVTTFIKGGLPTSEPLINWRAGKAAEYVVGFFQDWRTSEDEFPDAKALKEVVKRAKQAFKAHSDAAANIGSIVHDYAYLTELGRLDMANVLLANNADHPGRDKILNGVEKFLEWKKENKDELLKSEAIVASVRHHFGGKFDRLARRGNKIVLSDFKTSSGIFPDQFIQLGAYALAIEEWLDVRIDAVEILRFGKEEGEFEVKGFNKKAELKAFREQAIRCRETYEFNKMWGKKISGYALKGGR